MPYGTLGTKPTRKMAVVSKDTMLLNGTLAAPSYFHGLLATENSDTLIVPALTDGVDTGAMLNLTNETLSMEGNIALVMGVTGGSSESIAAWSELSLDGINWVINPDSFRRWEVSRFSDGSSTQKSAVSVWPPMYYLRFATAAIDVTVESETVTVNGSQSVDSLSLFWTLEQFN